MKYISIERYENIQQARIKVKSHLSTPSFFYALEPPQTLMGSSKILVLRNKKNGEISAKIDGPGFIIEELYKDFS